MNRPPHPSARVRRPLLAIALVALLLGGVVIGLAPSHPRAEAATSNGWTTTATVAPVTVPTGSSVSLRVTATSSTTRTALVDLEVYRGSTKVYQRYWDARSFSAGVARTFRVGWRVPANAAAGSYTVKVGMFGPGWSGLLHWNDGAASFTVTSPAVTSPTTAPTTAAPTTTTRPPVSTTTAPTTTTTAPTTTTAAPTTTTTGGSRYFPTLPVGSALPSDATCAAAVRPAAEVRPQNAVPNATRGHPTANPPRPMYARVTGNFVGTTDEIIQWAACKWGFDEDIVRAQTAVESYWVHSVVGDNGESFGVMQVREPYWGWAFPDSRTSTAYNLDVALAARRNCFEGNETWLNQFERGQDYRAGDLWGCVGLWFAGRWHTAAADDYTARVQQYLRDRVWTTPSFINYR